MECSICKHRGIAKGTLLCPRCGSLVERDEIMHQEDPSLVAAKELSLLKGKVVELASKKERFQEKINSQKLTIYLLGASLLLVLFLYFNKSDSKSAEAVLYQELKDAIAAQSHEIKVVKKELQLLNTPEPKEDYLTYTVKKGDSLAKIAGHFYGDFAYYEEIASINELSPPFLLRSGDQLKLKFVDDLANK